MELHSPGLFSYILQIGWSYTCTGHDYDTAGGLAYKLGNQPYSFGGGRGLAGSQQAVTSQLNYLFQSHLRLSTHIEGAMKGHAEAMTARGLYQTLHGVHIHRAVLMQGPDHDTGNTCSAAKLYRLQHSQHLILRKYEVSPTRTHKHIHRKAHRHGVAYQCLPGCDTAQVDALAQFHPARSPLKGAADSFGITATLFKQH